MIKRIAIAVAVLSATLLVVLVESSPAHAECERLYPHGVSKVCRAAQTPKIEKVNLVVTAITHPTALENDYCRLDAVFLGDFASWRAAWEDGRVKNDSGSMRSPWGDSDKSFDLVTMSLTDTELYTTLADENSDIWGYYEYNQDNRHTPWELNNQGLPENFAFLATVNTFVWHLREGVAGYTWHISVKPPREAANLEVLFNKCMKDIELVREGVERRQYIAKHELAIEMARQSALAEIEFLNGEIATMETALSDIAVLVTQATEAINSALERRRKLITLEEQYAETINAFWAEQTQSYMTFSAWAYERLSNIDQQLAGAEAFKATIETLESEFQAELEQIKERVRQTIEELEALASDEEEVH